MKVPPVRPHFFKPILQGFKNGLKIPVGFLKYLQGHDHIEHAILKRAGKKWLVKRNGKKLEEGWEKFAEEHDLQLGDLLIFRHEGEMEFDVTIFNISHCDREYAEYLQEQEKEAHVVEETSKNFKIKEEAATHHPVGQSQFVCTVKQYFLTNGYLRIPNKFARANGLINKKCGLIIRDESQRSWNLRIYTSCSHVYIGGRWGEFRAANDIKVGDQIMFEVVTNGEQPIWKFHDKTNPSTVEETSKNSEFKEAAPHNPIGQSHFECTIRPYCISKGYLRLPKQFAMANGLINKKCGLIIKDERQRSWNLRLVTYNSIVHISSGWSEFRVANDLKEGDYMMFEVVANGENPIWKFHNKPNPTLKSSSKAFSHVEAAIHKTFGHSRLICTIRPYCLTYGYLLKFGENMKYIPLICANGDIPFQFLPRQFALANGLISKKCDLIIRDEWQRSWNLILRPFGTSVCIRGGWHKFRDTYCLKEGDLIMFEVVTDGEKPIWKFHGKISGEDVSIIEQ